MCNVFIEIVLHVEWDVGYGHEHQNYNHPLPCKIMSHLLHLEFTVKTLLSVQWAPLNH